MKRGDMFSMKQIICGMESCTHKLNTYRLENRLEDMPYLLGLLAEYEQLLCKMVQRKLAESKEVTNEKVPEMSQNDPEKGC